MENFINKNTPQQKKPLVKKADNFLAEIQEKVCLIVSNLCLFASESQMWDNVFNFREMPKERTMRKSTNHKNSKEISTASLTFSRW